MSVEDRVRTATRARTDLVREIRPLELPARQPHGSEARRWLGFPAPVWTAPAAAAAVIVAVAVALVMVRAGRHQPLVSPAAPTGSAAAIAAGIAGGGPAATMPEYYAALDDPSGTAFSDPLPGHAVGSVSVLAGDSRTGRRLATVRPPRGLTFVGITAAADDRTFVLAAASLPVPWGEPSANPAAWYLLRITPGSADPAALTRLSIPGQSAGTQVSGIALSPSGSDLAVLFQQGVWSSAESATGPLTLSVYSVSTGRALRTWTQQTKGFPAGFGWYWGRYSNSSITWLANGHTLAFADGTNSGADGPPLGDAFSGVKIRTLDLNRPSGDLLADSTVVYTVKNHWCMTLQLTADGKTVICGSYGGSAVESTAYDPEITEYSVATGKARLVYRLGGAYALGLANVLWASPNGSTLIGSVLTQSAQTGPGDVIHRNAGLITKGALKPLAFPLGPPYVGEVAF